MRAPFPVCGHGAYEFRLDDGLKHCRCKACGHYWLIALAPGDEGVN